MSMSLRTFISFPLVILTMLAFNPALARADDDQPSDSSSSTAEPSDDSSVGRVEEPDNVRNAPSNEGASERAGAGFDTPWTPDPYNDGKADNLEPKPMTVTPNN
jgi:hypothetical protein